MAGDAAAGFGSDEVGGVGVNGENHIVGNKPEAAAGVGARIVEEAVTVLKGFRGGVRLLGRDGIERWKQCAIHCSCVIEERTKDALHSCFEFGGQ